MCTVQSIKDAIRESCQSQYDMESTDIDRVLQTLPFSEHEPMFSHPPKYKRPYRPWQNNKTAESHSLFHEGLWLFHALKLERSEVNGRFSH